MMREGRPLQGLDSVTRREDIVKAIVAYAERHGHAPSLRELGAAVGLTSQSTVYYHLGALRKAGRVTWIDGQNRSLKVTCPKYTKAPELAPEYRAMGVALRALLAAMRAPDGVLWYLWADGMLPADQGFEQAMEALNLASRTGATYDLDTLTAEARPLVSAYLEANKQLDAFGMVELLTGGAHVRA